MHFSRLSNEEAREILSEVADPSYREMNRLESGFARTHSAQTPQENLEQLFAWLKVLLSLGVKLEPSRELQESRVDLL
jgi:hypothetical protein